jgi:hypothetical protein
MLLFELMTMKRPYHDVAPLQVRTIELSLSVCRVSNEFFATGGVTSSTRAGLRDERTRRAPRLAVRPGRGRVQGTERGVGSGHRAFDLIISRLSWLYALSACRTRRT